MDNSGDLSRALNRAKNQGLITINGVHRDTGITRPTVRKVLRGGANIHTGTERALWAYLREKGAI